MPKTTKPDAQERRIAAERSRVRHCELNHRSVWILRDSVDEGTESFCRICDRTWGVDCKPSLYEMNEEDLFEHDMALARAKAEEKPPAGAE
ncbi:hypothetical protein LCGC14_0322870 [marine sediment metagenome]|uniref:Uncharacterized protein n=1 Tax=marine sediment metagenome TaxID=412755 RepID=A0A0F9WQQ0_9ZZZZ